MNSKELNARVLAACLWLAGHRMPHGGIMGSNHDRRAYPEVTGYLIPSMFNFGLKAMAYRSAAWLIETQCPICGGWPGWGENNCANKGACRSFDTSAIIEGLEFLAFRAGDTRVPESYYQSLFAARECLKDMIETDPVSGKSFMAVFKGGDSPQAYNLRSAAILERGYDYWLDKLSVDDIPWIFGSTERIHYIAYALEGLAILERMKEHERLLSKLRTLDRPFDFAYSRGIKNWAEPTRSGICVVGNFQMSVQLNDVELFDSMARTQLASGGFPAVASDPTVELAWPIKYFLEGAMHFYGAGLE